ncbi:MAG TPA: pitrilysin family protein [Verrucomicrobiae bacterium]|nr:pitrilysin family protein [Verrucomicrobiae bacterium]
MRMISATLLLALSLAGCAHHPPQPDVRTMAFPPLKFEVPGSQRFVLDNGIVVHLVEEHELPVVNATLYVRTGSIYEPAEKTGLAALTGAVMRSGGAGRMSPDTLDAELEFISSSVESSMGEDSGTVSFTTLRKNLDRTLELFAAVVQNPSFAPDRLEQARNRMLEGLRRQNDDPKEIADRELRRLVYLDSALARIPTPRSVRGITRDDLVSFHRRFYRPDGMILAVSGDITAAELREKLGRAFGGWERSAADLPPVPPLAAEAKPGVYLVRRDIPQAVVRMGHLGVTKDSPDLYAVRVLDYILGGNGFNSRLMAEIRSRRGLTYHVSSNFEVGRRFPGLFQAETESASATTGQAVGLMLQIMKEMQQTEVTPGELELAKESMINSFIFGFTRPDVVATQRARLEYYGYPEGYLENFRERIAKVTAAEVREAARKRLRPEAMLMVVVGNEKELDRPLSEFGEVRELALPETR